jgi:crotonobetainyl-CoA:carnitine CoA-transferase CaiB-like acyl-CoA transferase
MNARASSGTPVGSRDDVEVTGSLSDIKVLDLSLLLPGPLCGQMLADLGADVISVEPPAGDYTRVMPSCAYPVANRNKRAVVLDLKDPDAVDACLRLAATADVVIEGFRPGVVDRLGLGFEAVKRVNPRVVYCSVSGFGQDGPASQDPGHDLTYLSASGALSFPGHWSEPPRRQGVPFGDLAAATTATIAVLAALHERARTGIGGHVDVAITDAAMAFAAVRGGPRGDLDPARRLHLYPANDLFVTKDDIPVSIAVIEDHFWQSFRDVVGTWEPRILDPKFDSDDSRRANGDELAQLLVSVVRTKTVAEWEALLRDADVPVQPVLTLDRAMATPQSRHRGLVQDVEGNRYVLFPALRDGVPMGTIRTDAPSLGEHTEEVLNELALDPSVVQRLLRAVPAGAGKPS